MTRDTGFAKLACVGIDAEDDHACGPFLRYIPHNVQVAVLAWKLGLMERD